MTAVDMVTMAVSALGALTAIAFTLIANARAHEAVESARAAAASERRAAEYHAAEDHLEVDNGKICAPALRVVQPDELMDCLIDGAVRRHPAGRAR